MPENVPKPLTPSAFMPSAFMPFGGEFDQFFNRMVRAWSFGMLEPNGQLRVLRPFDHAPRAEVQENGKSYTISDEKTHYTERSYGSFTRAFTLPTDGDRDGITADFAKGVLTLHVPKTANGKARAKQIEVRPS